MKLRYKDFTLNGPGVAKLTPENPEDLWVCYNLIAKGDCLSAATIRKVQRETSSGSKEAERVHTRLEVEVEAIDYDNVANVLRIRGKNVTENEHVKLGAYHTLEIDQQRPFSLAKDHWDSIAIDTLRVACDPAATADVAALMIQEGLGYVCLVGQSVTTTKTRIETSIPRKHGPAIAGYDKAVNKFLENVLQAVLRHIDFNVVRCLIVAGPGFTKDQFYSYMLSEATKRELRPIIDNKSKIVLVHASSGYKHALKEVLSAPSIMSLIMDTKAAKEVKALKDFFDMLSNDPSRAIYGPREVEVAHDRLAIQTLLLTDELFRNADVVARRKYVNLTDSIKASGGEVHVFSSMHVSGERNVSHLNTCKHHHMKFSQNPIIIPSLWTMTGSLASAGDAQQTYLVAIVDMGSSCLGGLLAVPCPKPHLARYAFSVEAHDVEHYQGKLGDRRPGRGASDPASPTAPS